MSLSSIQPPHGLSEVSDTYQQPLLSLAFSRCSLPRWIVIPHVLTQPPALQQLHRLNRSSPDFHHQLSNALRAQEYQQCVLNLQGDDLAWLVDYLNEVRRCVAIPRSLFKLSQALGDLDPSSPTPRTCLRELRNICGTRAILPTSYPISPDLLTTGPNPFASGSYGDVYEGTLDGSRVCIKRVRVYAQDGPQKTTKVRL